MRIKDLDYYGVFIEVKLLKPNHIEFIKKHFTSGHQVKIEDELAYKWITLYNYRSLSICLGCDRIIEKYMINPNKLFNNIKNKLK